MLISTCRLLRHLLSGLLVSVLAGCMLIPADPASGTVGVPDPYRWLESPAASTQVSDWLTQQAQKTRDWQHQQPSYASIRAQLQAAWDHPKWTVASIHHDQVFFYHNAGLAEHYSLYVQPYADFVDHRKRHLPPGGSARLLIDGNGFAEGTRPGAISISPDARWLAYQVNRRTASGKQQSLWYLQSLGVQPARPQLLAVSHEGWTLPAEQLAWDRHAERLLFSVSAPTAAGGWQSRIYARELSSALSAPVQIHVGADGVTVEQLYVLDGRSEPQGGRRSAPSLLVATASAADNDWRWCLLRSAPATADVPSRSRCQALISGSGSERFIGVINDMPAFITEGERGTGAVTLVAAGQRRELIAEQAAPLHSALVVGQTLVLEYLVHGSSTLRFADLQGQAINDDLARLLPEPVRVEALRATDGGNLLLTYSGMLTPPRSVLIDLQNGQQTVLTEDRPDLALDGLQARLARVHSGSSRVPVWVAGSAIRHDRLPEQMLLEVYGGFAAPLDISFSISRLVWMVNGGGYAVAGPRGGGDYGERWHQAGSGQNRHNSLADVLAVADWLRRRQPADQGGLAISGRSHGGLLAAEAVHQAPRLFAALVTEAAVLDLLNVDALGGARFWRQEYDGATTSPYQSLLVGGRALAEHPPALLITRDNDEIVAPAHSFKYLQALQVKSPDVHGAALLAVSPGQEHQPGGGIDQLIDDYALRWTFLDRHLAADRVPR